MGSNRSRTGTQNSTHLDGASPQAHSGPLGLAVSQPPAALTHCHPRQWTEEPPRQAAQRVDKSARPTSAKWTFDQCCLEDTRLSLNTPKSGSTWAVQSVKRLTLGFGSGHDLAVREFELCVRVRAESVEPAWDSLSLKIHK